MRAVAFTLATLSALAAVLTLAAAAPAADSGEAVEVRIFDGHTLHFTPDDTTAYDIGDVANLDRGRVAVRKVALPDREGPSRVFAIVRTRPVPADELSMHDGWDRAGNVRLCPEGTPEIEMVKFVTAYGGATEHEVDVSHLAPLLIGERTFKAFVDTWSSPGWLVDLTLRFVPVDTEDPQPPDAGPDWCEGVLYHEGLTEELLRDGPVEVVVEIPEDIGRVVMNYLVSGHCTDGRGADEFVSKDNVIAVDGTVVYRFRPWRDDCRRFREVNPYTRRWSDGWWSSDYSRSGWCPGDRVRPVSLDLTDHLTPGRHAIAFNIEGARPADGDGHFGYWRVSSHLVGWRKP